MRQVIEFCKFHVEANAKVDDKPAKTEDEIKQWDSEFVKVDQTTLFDLILVSRCACMAPVYVFKHLVRQYLAFPSAPDRQLGVPARPQRMLWEHGLHRNCELEEHGPCRVKIREPEFHKMSGATGDNS